VLNPSGPGDLSEGKLFTTASISSWEKGETRLERSTLLSSKDGRSNVIPV
jgi:hypothetical protein